MAADLTSKDPASKSWAQSNAHALQSMLDAGVGGWDSAESQLLKMHGLDDVEEERSFSYNSSSADVSFSQSGSASEDGDSSAPQSPIRLESDQSRPTSDISLSASRGILDVSLGSYRPASGVLFKAQPNLFLFEAQPDVGPGPEARLPLPDAGPEPERVRPTSFSDAANSKVVAVVVASPAVPGRTAAPPSTPAPPLPSGSIGSPAPVSALSPRRSLVQMTTQERQHLEDELARARASSAELSVTVASLRAQVTAEQERTLLLQALVNRSSLHDQEAKHEIKMLQTVLTRHQDTVASKDQDLRSLQQVLREQQEKMISREKDFSTKESRLSEEHQQLSFRLMSIVREKESLQTDILRQNELNAQLKTQLQQKAMLLAEIEAKSAALERERSSLSSELVRHVQESEELKGRLQAKNKEIADARVENIIAKERNSILESQAEALQLSSESKYRAAEKSKLSVESKLESLVTRLQDSTVTSKSSSTVASDNTQILLLQSALAQEQERYRTLQNSSQMQLDSLRSGLQQQNEELKAKISEYKSKVSELGDAKRSIETRHKALADERRRLQDDAAMYRVQTEKMDIQMEHAVVCAV